MEYLWALAIKLQDVATRSGPKPWNILQPDVAVFAPGLNFRRNDLEVSAFGKPTGRSFVDGSANGCAVGPRKPQMIQGHRARRVDDDVSTVGEADEDLGNSC